MDSIKNTMSLHVPSQLTNLG